MADPPQRRPTLLERIRQHPVVATVAFLVGAIVATAGLIDALRNIGDTIAPDSHDAGPAIAQDDEASTAEDVRVAIDVLRNDLNVAQERFALNLVAAPGFGDVRLLEDKRFEYTPAEDYSGLDEFTYAISRSDGTQSSAVVRVRVDAVNDAPAIRDKPLEFHYPATTVALLTVDDFSADTDGDDLGLVSFELEASGYQPRRAGDISDTLRALIGRLPAARRAWARNAIILELDNWAQSVDWLEANSPIRTTLSVSVEDSQGALASGAIPVILTIGLTAALTGKCRSASDGAPRRLELTVFAEGGVTRATSVAEDRLGDFMIGMLDLRLPVVEVDSLRVRADWDRSDNPFELQCALGVLSDGIEIPLMRWTLRGRASVTSAERSVALGLGKRIEDVTAVYSRIYERPISFD